jgi:adenosine kinase
MTALICGSMAYDNIMVFDGRFKDHILPDKIHMLNVAFLVPALRREFGGCAGNIAFNLRLLGSDGLAMATVGDDIDPYLEWLDGHGVSREFIHRVPGTFTAQAYITTDLDDNQITAFHPGAMNHSHEQAVPAGRGVTWGMVSPDGRQGMLDHAAQFAEAGIPFVFDPGQGLPMFGGEELQRFVEQAAVVAVNDYEGQMLMQRCGWSETDIADRVDALIVTRGGDGSTIHADGRVYDIPAARPDSIVDPTGCGDAYRAGLLHGLMAGADWETTGRIASLMGAIKIASAGTQNHSLDRESFRSLFEANFGYEPAL